MSDGQLSGAETRPSWGWALDFVLCPVCRQTLTVHQLTADGRDAVLAHGAGSSCHEAYPVIDGVLRLLTAGARGRLARERADWFGSSPLARNFTHWTLDAMNDVSLRLVARFDREWRAFSRVGTDEQERVFSEYFDLVPKELLQSGRFVLDAGCGGGRWAFAVQRRGARVLAIDLGRSVEMAERSTRETGRVACVQADIRDLPVRSGRFDLVYSLGVLHHIDPTESAVRALATAVRPGGALLIYLYYALEGRSHSYRALYRASDTLRRISSRLPESALIILTTAVALLVYYPLARLARLLRAAGLQRLADSLPLNFYADLSFTTMRNDSLDRFGTTLEKRFTRGETHQLLEGARLRGVVVSDRPPYWHAVGRVPDHLRAETGVSLDPD